MVQHRPARIRLAFRSVVPWAQKNLWFYQQASNMFDDTRVANAFELFFDQCVQLSRGDSHTKAFYGK